MPKFLSDGSNFLIAAIATKGRYCFQVTLEKKVALVLQLALNSILIFAPLSQVKLLITNNPFYIVQKATAQSKTGVFRGCGVDEAPPGF
jgi:hypothetical protein